MLQSKVSFDEFLKNWTPLPNGVIPVEMAAQLHDLAVAVVEERTAELEKLVEYAAAALDFYGYPRASEGVIKRLRGLGRSNVKDERPYTIVTRA